MKGFPGVKGDVQGVQVKADVYGVSWGQRRPLIGPLMICVAIQYRGFKGVKGKCLGVHAGHLGVQVVVEGIYAYICEPDFWHRWAGVFRVLLKALMT